MKSKKPAKRDWSAIDRKTKPVTISLPPIALEMLDTIAKRQGRNRSATISAIVFAAFHGWDENANPGVGARRGARK